LQTWTVVRIAFLIGRICAAKDAHALSRTANVMGSTCVQRREIFV
jgi:hypothetical protein